MHHIKWHNNALHALGEIGDYFLSKEEPGAGANLIEKIERSIARYIAFMPYMFPALGADASLRACYLPHPYIIYYRVDDETRTVTILDIVHGARQSRRR